MKVLLCPHLKGINDSARICLSCLEEVCLEEKPQAFIRVERYAERNRTVKELRKAGMPVSVLAKQFSLTPQAIRYILMGGNHHRKKGGLEGRADE